MRRVALVAMLLQVPLTGLCWYLATTDPEAWPVAASALTFLVSGPAALFIHGTQVWLVYLLLQAVQMMFLGGACTTRATHVQRPMLICGAAWWVFCSFLAVAVGV